MFLKRTPQAGTAALALVTPAMATDIVDAATAADVAGDNGVIRVINTVLLPK